MMPIAFALGATCFEVAEDESRDTEQVLAAVVIEGDERDKPLEVARLLRCSGRFWVERILGKRQPFGSFECAMKELERVALAYDGRLSVR
jgi:hypothetical protein